MSNGAGAIPRGTDKPCGIGLTAVEKARLVNFVQFHWRVKTGKPCAIMELLPGTPANNGISTVGISPEMEP